MTRFAHVAVLGEHRTVLIAILATLPHPLASMFAKRATIGDGRPERFATRRVLFATRRVLFAKRLALFAKRLVLFANESPTCDKGRQGGDS
jgi:hypothetical protein